jgi:hypothetical protein
MTFRALRFTEMTKPFLHKFLPPWLPTARQTAFVLAGRQTAFLENV